MTAFAKHEREALDGTWRPTCLGSGENERVEGDPLEINRVVVGGAAAIHGGDPIDDSEALIGGADWLGEEERTALAASVGSVGGLDVIHVQCHVGFDTISLARRGARVVGLDFSAAALAKAEAGQTRARDSQLGASGRCPIPAELHGRFDLAYATIGAICWIEDIAAWMRSSLRRCVPGVACARRDPPAAHNGRRARAILTGLPLRV